MANSDPQSRRSSGLRGQRGDSEYRDYSVTLSNGAKGESGEYHVKLNKMGLAGLLIGLVAIERKNLDDLSDLKNVTVRTDSRAKLSIKENIPNDIIINQEEEAFGSDEESIRQNQKRKYAVRIEFSREIIIQYSDKSFETGLEEALRIEGLDPDEYLRYY